VAPVVVVTPERSPLPLSGAPVPVSVLTAADLALAPQRALDDVLRGTPGFTLFRASSSRVANPTAQGLTLRGLGGSGWTPPSTSAGWASATRTTATRSRPGG